VKHHFEAYDASDIVAVWEWFEFQNELLAEGHAYILRSRTTAPVATHRFRPYEPRFKSLTLQEIAEFFDAQSSHLELLAMFALLATTEAILRIEFNGVSAAKSMP
jgi:hypothetical protein